MLNVHVILDNCLRKFIAEIYPQALFQKRIQNNTCELLYQNIMPYAINNVLNASYVHYLCNIIDLFLE